MCWHCNKKTYFKSLTSVAFKLGVTVLEALTARIQIALGLCDRVVTAAVRALVSVGALALVHYGSCDVGEDNQKSALKSEVF